MTFSQVLRNLTVGLVTLLGVLTGVILALWLHTLLYGLWHPSAVQPWEDWRLALGFYALLLHIAAASLALAIAALTRYRWIAYGRGRLAVWSLIAVGLVQIGFVIWMAYSAQLHSSLIWGLAWSCPLVLASRILPQHRAAQR